MARRRLTQQRERDWPGRTRTTVVHPRACDNATQYEHTDCGVDCRACDAEFAAEGRPDDLRWDDDL